MKLTHKEKLGFAVFTAMYLLFGLPLIYEVFMYVFYVVYLAILFI